MVPSRTGKHRLQPASPASLPDTARDPPQTRTVASASNS
jgi:hypothetical protein